MTNDIGRSRGTDFFRIADQLTPEELDYWNRTRRFVDGRSCRSSTTTGSAPSSLASWSRSSANSASSATGSRATAARR